MKHIAWRGYRPRGISYYQAPKSIKDSLLQRPSILVIALYVVA